MRKQLLTIHIFYLLISNAFYPAFASPLKCAGQDTSGVSPAAGIWSFADSVAHFDPGAIGTNTGDEPDTAYRNPAAALGQPFMDSDSGFVSLGRGGTLILQFTDNRLIDQPGYDLFVAMRNQNDEAARVWVSEDGNYYYFIGTVDSGTQCLDLENKAPAGLYRFVKLRDVYERSSPGIKDMGADIDGISAVHSVIIYTIKSDSLFEPIGSIIADSSAVKLLPVYKKIQSFKNASVIIRAFSDNRGSNDFKLLLTQQQAAAVRDFLVDEQNLPSEIFTIIGMGKKKPAASNTTDAGQSVNRRIEILVYPEL